MTAYDPTYFVHAQFADVAAKNPEKVALCFRNDSLTYGQLDDWSSELASTLQQAGVGPEELVGICVERSIEMVVAMLAVLKAGGAYVPLDPAYPRERLGVMLDDAGARVLISQRALAHTLPGHVHTVLMDDHALQHSGARPTASARLTPNNLAYVIFTSGSTGRPKGVMVEHRNVCNFFVGMDEVLGTEPGVWLAVTSISFDISVLELLWTLCRGYKVVIQEEGDRASLLDAQRGGAPQGAMGFGLFYFAADSTDAASRDAYKLLLEGARFADEHDFVAVWTPERHFHAFGGLYPNAAVTSAALAVLTTRVQIRAGSVVLPLHNPIRVAEDWAVVDNLSGGRVGLSFASGWHANDFALMPENYGRRRELMHEQIATVLSLWRGEKIRAVNGEGKEVELSILPRPVRERPPLWIASAGTVETFETAGRNGHNVLTNMLGQDLADLKSRFAAYRKARKEAGHVGEGIISVMLHTFVCGDDEEARRLAKEPFCNYLASSYDLVKVAPWMFPAFKQPSQGGTQGAFDPRTFDSEDMRALLDHAFERYFETAGLFGTPERALSMVERLKGIGATEVACLIDFGIDPELVLSNLKYLDRLRRLANPSVAPTVESNPRTVGEQIAAHGVTHLQCTPSQARLFLTDGTNVHLGELRTLLLGGEALPPDLVQKLELGASCRVVNMYGPTETTVWSTTHEVRAGEPVTIGRPLANTVVRVLDEQAQLCSAGTPGELHIGGDGVTRGYLRRDDLTADRFKPDPFETTGRLYRTGDLARLLPSGELEYLGRMDEQIKLNGYRIELGEIESVMAKHPDVRQAVVAVREWRGERQLVGYFKSGQGLDAESSQDPNGWGQRWNEAYRRRVGAEGADARFDTAGWLSSATGAPYSEAEMKEWANHTVEQIRRLRPRRILEVGCGTGMILFGCLNHVESYTGIDLSENAIQRIRDALSPEERTRVTLARGSAHELDGLVNGSFDLVVLNSVVQYFPSAAYLHDVLGKVSALVATGGNLFLGDLRSLAHCRLFHAWVELHRAAGPLGYSSVTQGIERRCEQDPELAVAPALLADWARSNPTFQLLTLSLKAARADNEMSLFRYDAVLSKGAPLEQIPTGDIPVLTAPSLASIAEVLGRGPSELLVRAVSNARLTALQGALRRLEERGTDEAESLRSTLSAGGVGIHPSDLSMVDSDYWAELRWGSDEAEVDVMYRRKGATAFKAWPLGVLADGAQSNAPASSRKRTDLGAELRRHLAEFLPLYMLPAFLVEVEAFPLTPNGKVDRKALPDPTSSRARSAPTPATNDLERTIADIWHQLLGVEQVGTRDNLFELGASSLMTVEANTLLQKALGRKVPLVNMFRYPTIERLAAYLATADHAGTDPSARGQGSTAGKDERMRAAAERRRQARARTQSE
jgi:natural product biosynthesis luciferase-like monooxygenase protein